MQTSTPAGHPIEIGHTFQENILPDLLSAFNIEQREHHRRHAPPIRARLRLSL